MLVLSVKLFFYFFFQGNLEVAGLDEISEVNTRWAEIYEDKMVEVDESKRKVRVVNSQISVSR